MPSITPMMSTIFFDEAVIDPIVSTTCATTDPPCAATSEAWAASWFACRALSAFRCTVPVSACIEFDVQARDIAWDSVRADRSCWPIFIFLIIMLSLLSRRCAQVLTDLFLPRAVLLTVLVPDRRHFPASRRAIAGGSAGRHRLARHG